MPSQAHKVGRNQKLHNPYQESKLACMTQAFSRPTKQGGHKGGYITITFFCDWRRFRPHLALVQAPVVGTSLAEREKAHTNMRRCSKYRSIVCKKRRMAEGPLPGGGGGTQPLQAIKTGLYDPCLLRAPKLRGLKSGNVTAAFLGLAIHRGMKKGFMTPRLLHSRGVQCTEVSNNGYSRKLKVATNHLCGEESKVAT